LPFAASSAEFDPKQAKTAGGTDPRQNIFGKPLNLVSPRSNGLCGTDRGKIFFTAAESGPAACE
jgi:hypothetical protein